MLVSLLTLSLAINAGLGAAPTLEVSPGRPSPGDPVLVTVRGVKDEPKASLSARPLRFYPLQDGFQAVAPLPVEHPQGTLALEVKLASGSSLTAELEVVDPQWRTRELTVAKKFVKPPKSVRKRMEEDRKAFARAFDQPWSPPRFSRSFEWPRRDVLTAYFGDLRTYNGEKQSQHYGTDVDGNTGDPVVATNDGKVVMVRDNYASGLTVVIDHGAGIFTTYFHLSAVKVKQGAKVKQGQLLGAVGKSGRVTGPHLHFGAKVDGLYVDAETLLKLDFSALTAAKR